MSANGITATTELEEARINKTEIGLHPRELGINLEATIERCVQIELIGPNNTKLENFFPTGKERHCIYIMDHRGLSIPADAILVLEGADLESIESGRAEDRAMLLLAVADATFSQEPCLGLSHLTTKLPDIERSFQEGGIAGAQNAVNQYLGMFAKAIARAETIAKECGYTVDTAFTASLRGIMLSHAGALYQKAARAAPEFWDRETDIQLFDPIKGVYRKAYFQKTAILQLAKDITEQKEEISESGYPPDYAKESSGKQQVSVNTTLAATFDLGYKEQEPLFRAVTRAVESIEAAEIEEIAFEYDFTNTATTMFGGTAYEVKVTVITDHGEIVLNDFMPPGKRIFGNHHPLIHYYCWAELAEDGDAGNIIVDPQHILNDRRRYRDAVISTAHEIGHSYTLLPKELWESKELTMGISVMERIAAEEGKQVDANIKRDAPDTPTDRFYETDYSLEEFNNFLLYLTFRNIQETEAWNHGKVVARAVGISDIEYEDAQAMYISTYWYDTIRRAMYVADRCSAIGDERLVEIYNLLLQNDEEVTIGELRKLASNPNTSAREKTNMANATNTDF